MSLNSWLKRLETARSEGVKAFARARIKYWRGLAMIAKESGGVRVDFEDSYE